MLPQPLATELRGRAPAASFNAAGELLRVKIANIHQDLKSLKPVVGDDPVRACCLENLRMAEVCIAKRWRGSHPHLAWRFLHRAEEDLLLLVSDDRFKASAVDVKLTFDLNIIEPSVRSTWLGTEGNDRGALVSAIERFAQAQTPEERVQAREVVRTALRIVNDVTDHRFCVLSQNVLTSVSSGGMLFAMMIACAVLSWDPASPSVPSYLTIGLVGAIGAYVSNLVTRKDFLFIQGGPFWRYLLHPMLAKPSLSAFAALFVYAVARSGLLFSIVEAGSTEPLVPIVFHVAKGGSSFAYLALAVASGFAADKLVREMIDRVLKRLEENADSTIRTKGPEPKPA